MEANNSGEILWGIDLGGTKTELVVINIHDNETTTLFRERVSTEAHKGYEHILSKVAGLKSMAIEKTGLQPEIIGVGAPGALDPQRNCIKNSNTTCLNGMPLKQDLEKVLSMPVVLANDANCFALAETKFGAGTIFDNIPEVVFGVILGTGVGGGLVVNGKLINGTQGIAGEWGHNELELHGNPCYCGKRGCVETVISGPALEKFYESHTGESLALHEIEWKSREEHDESAMKTIERLHYFFGKGMATVINILDPELIVIGGGVGNISSLYRDGVQMVEKWVFNTRLQTRILPPQMGDSAGVVGAALLTG